MIMLIQRRRRDDASVDSATPLSERWWKQSNITVTVLITGLNNISGGYEERE